MSPNVTFFDVMGKRIVSIETPEGFVHVCDKQVFEHVSDAVRHIKGEAPNPVIAEMNLQAVGVDVDGEIRPVAELSYAPEVVKE